jgi:hypothetical protein
VTDLFLARKYFSYFRKLGSGFHDLLRNNTSSVFMEHRPISSASSEMVPASGILRMLALFSRIW